MVLLTIGLVFAVVASLLHVLFFYLESIVFTRPTAWPRFGVTSQSDADVMKPMAYNQGCTTCFSRSAHSSASCSSPLVTPPSAARLRSSGTRRWRVPAGTG